MNFSRLQRENSLMKTNFEIPKNQISNCYNVVSRTPLVSSFLCTNFLSLHLPYSFVKAKPTQFSVLHC